VKERESVHGDWSLLCSLKVFLMRLMFYSFPEKLYDIVLRLRLTSLIDIPGCH
jgi:hypothetical protein